MKPRIDHKRPWREPSTPDLPAPTKVIVADITTLTVDAIVNAANTSLLGGGGVDGAIHRAAGHALLEACRSLGGCRTGDAKITPGFALPARYVIHTVGPVWHGGDRGEPALLESCYRRSCEVAIEHDDIASIAFPCISTGVYGYPINDAAKIAVETCRKYADRLDITFCCFSESDAAHYNATISRAS